MPSSMEALVPAVTAVSGIATVCRHQMPFRPTNILEWASSRDRLPWLPSALALCFFGFGVNANVALADGVSAPPPPAASNPSSQTIAITPAAQSVKPIVLPEFKVNGLREQLDNREKIMAKKPWGDFMCLNNGGLIDNFLFAYKYKAEHPNELVRLVMWSEKDEVAGNMYYYGIGQIADCGMISAFLVYTSGDDLHARCTLWGDRVYPYFKARQISRLKDRELRSETWDMIRMAQCSDVGVTHANETAQGLAGDNPNLQVRYAEAKLKEVGMPGFVVPAAEKTSPNNDLMLIFYGGEQTWFVWRPYYGAYRLKKDAYAKFGIKEAADANAK
jgi:hypothetical protein